MVAGFIKIDAKRVETTALNTKVNKDIFDNFKVYCKTLGYPMNVMLETFMRQYTNGKFKMSDEEIKKWNKDESERATLNTTFNKEIYSNFKLSCKRNGHFVSSVIVAFMEEIISKEYVMEFVLVE